MPPSSVLLAAAPASVAPVKATRVVDFNRYFADLDWATLLTQWSLRIAGALAILVIGLWLARKVSHLLERSMSRFDRADPILRSFLRNVVYAALAMVVIIAALTQLGVPPASLLTVLGAAGLAIGLALKDSLSNIASGVMLMGLRPFHAGHQVRIAGIEGIVEQVRIFTTHLRTPQNEDILIPNSEITKAPIFNFTARPQRRVDVTVTLHMEESIDPAAALLLAAARSVDGVLDDPPVECVVARFDELGAALTLSAWVATPEYLRVRGELLQRAHAVLRSNGMRMATRHAFMPSNPTGTDPVPRNPELL